MDSPEILIAFGAVMLVIALLAVAIDWFGKPMRHRRFVPKIYRFPDERQPRRSQVRETEWSDTAFVLPVVESPTPEVLVRYPDPRSSHAHLGPAPAAARTPQFTTPRVHQGAADIGPPTAQVQPIHIHDQDVEPAVDLVTLEDRLGPDAAGLLRPDGTIGHEPEGLTGTDREVEVAAAGEFATHDEDGSDQSGGVDDVFDQDPNVGGAVSSGSPGAPGADARSGERRSGWSPGDYVFNLTSSGAEPTADTVRSRYWKNVAATAGASMFGDVNAERMAGGKPPERRNPRSGRVEVMRLPRMQYEDAQGVTPVPEWPGSGLDPFAD